MTPQEVALFKYVGQTFLFRDLATPLIAFVTYGISIPLILYAISILRSRTTKQRTLYTLLYGTGGCFIFLTAHLAGEIAKLALDFNLGKSIALSDGNFKTLIKELDYVNDRNWNPVLLRNWVDSIALIASDAVVIWRACVLLPTRQTWAIFPPIFLLFASAVLSITSCILGSTIKGSHVGVSPRAVTFNKLTEAAYFLSLGANVLATAVFGYRLRRLRKMRRKSDPRPVWSGSSVQGTLWLLIESGLVFCASQVAVIIMLLLSILQKIRTLPHALAFDLITRVQYSLSIVYPILVVVLVQTRNSAAMT